MLKLRSLGLNDYSVLERQQRIGRIRFAEERLPPRWLWAVTIHLPGGLPTGSAPDFSTAKVEFKAAWKALAQLEQLTASFRVSTGSGLSRIKGLGWAEG